MLRMRLRRTGAKKQPHYRVVIAEARSRRDGPFIDIVGFYNPLTEPATIRIDPDKALRWLSRGVQPSDTVQRLLRSAGVLELAESTARGNADGGEPASD
ncbi:MAG: 30S ribosomal protein S16 [Chloroflexi bacterium]|nr:30S ribosomal protein S16 [Chloroflexota bacterium]